MMRRIERLPESIHSSVRSGVVICDMTRIVEELVFNSLDAGATKVSVAVGIGSSYLKVVDNGSGITRDGLVMLGERYATSKADHLFLMDTANESFDFRGEALCSISDVSLLEIVTKARGKPNGYRKMMKNCKCLFLGISDDRQDVGTTVTVRDIFYNQPVRRKHMDSSPKKILDSIRMSVLRIALVHADVSFKVVDVDSAEELLHTKPSCSPLEILFSNFGIENSAAFRELNIADCELKLSGYISDPRGILALKAIQYVYINSRFICKGPIHKLLNQLAAKFDFSSFWQPETNFLNEKGSKCDMCPTFILNLYCPRSYYDIATSERSRTSVEFQDWGRILTFIENGVIRLWAGNISHDVPHNLETGKKRCKKKNCRTSPDLCSPKRTKLSQDYENMPAWEEFVFACGKPSTSVSELKKHQTEGALLSETDYLSQSCDGSLASYEVIMNKGSHSYVSPPIVSSPAHHQSVLCTDDREDGRSYSILGNIMPTFCDDIDISIERRVSADCLRCPDDIHINQDFGRSFLRHCSFEKKLLHGNRLPANDERFEFGGDVIGTRENWDDNDIMVDEKDLVSLRKDMHCDRNPPYKTSPMIQFGLHEIPELDSVKSSLVHKTNLPDSSKQVGKRSSSQRSLGSRWSRLGAEQIIGIKFQNDEDDDHTSYDFVQGHAEFGEDTRHGSYAKREAENLTCSNLNTFEGLWQKKCSFMNFSPDHNHFSYRKREVGEIRYKNFENLFSPKLLNRFSETDWSPLQSYSQECRRNHLVPSSNDSLPAEHECGRSNSRTQETWSKRKRSSIRSRSAPPIYKGKKRYLDLTNTSSMLSAKSNLGDIHETLSSMEPSNSNHTQLLADSRNLKSSQKPPGEYQQSPMERSAVDCFASDRPGLQIIPEVTTLHIVRSKKKVQIYNQDFVECPDVKEIQDSFDPVWKWRNCSLLTAGGSIPHNNKNHDTILDISSDVLHFAGDSLVPTSIDRASLEDAKVLNQVDKKFIAVVARKTLAMIDQHAADERIRLEELRHKVLSGEMKTITYLEDERDLILPEISYQLLHNYSEQIQLWGWVCNIHSLDASSFTKNLDFLHRKSTVVKLLAVPCILGVNLTDNDLLEFLQQLADTDGSLIIPPSVLRVLNNKACRGAIMFGDTLLPSECSLIVEELKRTSLCFQCAHGRPTTVPLVNLDLLHNKIAKLGSHESWHGLHQHKLSFKRTAERLRFALS